MGTSPKLLRRKTGSLSSMSKSKSLWNISEVGRRNTLVLERAKVTQLLKTTQIEQLSKLQSKHQQECELLDEIRNFAKQRSQLDREYGLALQKLVLQYQKKDIPKVTEGNHTTVVSVWQSVLDATDKTAQARLVSSENYKNGISEAAKNCRTHKDNNLKKCQDLLNTIQNGISETVKDLTKAKKKYFELEQLASSAREKFQEVEERRKKKQPGIFKSQAGLEKTSQKLEQKCDECNKSSTIARNEYILALATANAHQKKYYEVDIPECMRILDGDIFTKLQDYLSAASRYELETGAVTQKAYAVSLQCSTMISREFSTRCFLNDNSVFVWGPKYEFEACEDDTNNGELVAEHGSTGEDNSLNREARKWAGRFVRENKQVQKLTRIRQNLEGIRNKYTENPELTTEANIADTETRIDKCLSDLRRVETNRLKSESKLNVLRHAPGVDVDSWIQSAINQMAKEPSNSVPSTPIDPNKKFSATEVDTPNGRSVTADDSSFFDDDFDDTFDEAFDEEVDHDEVSLTASDHSRVYPVSCKVIYGYTGTRPDELTISPGDIVEVVEDGDLEQWVKAKDKNNRVGYVPEKYLEFPAPTNSNTMNNHSGSSSIFEKSPSIVSGGSNHSNNFYISSTNLTDTGTTLSSISGSSSTSGTSSLTTSSYGSAMTNNDDRHPTAASGAMVFAKAIYEYEGCTDDELTFPEGAIIRIIAKDDNGVDDGWWKGELNGNTGVFPALVVEEMTSEEQDYKPVKKTNNWISSTDTLESPELEGPPKFHPPPPSLNIPKNINNNYYQQMTMSASLPTTPVKQAGRPTRIAPPPPQRPRSASRPT
ncbi:F-BAR and double SH3 domains protein 2-like isoform X2 [Styela clava]